MKRCIGLCVVLLLAGSAMAQTQTSKLMKDIVSRSSGALVVLKYTVAIETGDRTGAGQAICITSDGVFLTTSLDPRMRVDKLKDFELVLPGVDGKKLKAKLLGIDPWTGLGFVKCTEKHQWQVVQFSPSSNVSPGDEVASVGLMMSDPSWPVYVGSAYVSTKLHVPNELVFVSGGRLTGSCSPVFAADGRAIGIIGRQLPLAYETPTRRGMAPIQLVDQQQTAFFTPVEEFVHVLKNIPSDGKVARLPWLGINKFEAVDKDTASVLDLTQPGVRVDQVIKGQPAAKAGIADRNVIIGLNGKPIKKLATPDLTVKNFVRTLMRMRVGTVVKLTILGVSGKPNRDVSVTLEAMPTRPNEAKQYYNKQIGLLIREEVPLDEFLGEKKIVPGVIVVAMVRDSAASVAGLQNGDIITNANNQPVSSVDSFKEVVEKSLATNPTGPINLLVRRGEEAQQIIIRPTTGS